LIRRIFTPLRIAILGIVILIFCSVFAFFYAKYARMIDARLRGDIVVRTTGIYASPRIIRVSQAMTLPSLKSYLDGIGYVESSKDADSNRGRYLIKGNVIDIQTSAVSVINGSRQFPNLTIIFGAGGKGITKITDSDTKRNLDSSVLEPELVTAISNEKQRQKQKLVSFKDLPRDYINAVVAIEDR